MEYHIKEDAQPMTAQREVTIMEAAIAKWGEPAQMIVAIEELSELQKALCKYLRFADRYDGDDPGLGVLVNSIREEMADVSIMLSQLELIFGDVTDKEIWKLERLDRRLGEA